MTGVCHHVIITLIVLCVLTQLPDPSPRFFFKKREHHLPAPRTRRRGVNWVPYVAKVRARLNIVVSCTPASPSPLDLTSSEILIQVGKFNHFWNSAGL